MAAVARPPLQSPRVARSARAGCSRAFPAWTLLAAASIYSELYADPDDGSIPATFQLIYLTGWSPHESQQRPLPRGSGEVSLKTLESDLAGLNLGKGAGGITLAKKPPENE